MTSVPDPADDRSQRERMIAGDWYVSDDELGEAQHRAAVLADRYHRAWLADAPEAQDLLAELLGGLGAETVVRPPVSVDYGSHVVLGERTFVNYFLTAADVATITIGDDCLIGPNVQLLTPIHPSEPGPRRAKWERAEPISIGDNVWLGGGVTVLPGVTIGENSVIGAAAVVTRDVPANVVAVGNPARVIREL
ncbi:maltose acetyltransferase [Brachybacterium sp. P6-10-X1]|uniref:sugar O-acetyltransferase n=1 Tax=Brachybacterium sp. P6-10-X1 TaxID=1903186 RepID=UPI0009718AC9|nr:sugar O-acetyltransferase [Brachybacterium sp. P6-10-X1]APX33562.1 maltose acetyltransferase [Brachybacterium sp. P6-10-X1]